MNNPTKYCPACNKTEKRSECAYGSRYFDMYAQPINQEDAPVNNVGGGQIAGVGVGSQGEPGITKKKRQILFGDFIRRKSSSDLA